MIYLVKLVRMLDGKRVESWLGDELHPGGLRYNRSDAANKAIQLWQVDGGSLVAVELVEVT